MGGELTGPVRARPERDAEDHEDRAGGLEAHHGDAERADELDARALEAAAQRVYERARQAWGQGVSLPLLYIFPLRLLHGHDADRLPHQVHPNMKDRMFYI